MKDYTGWNDQASDAILAKKIELGLGQIEEQLRLDYEEAKAMEWREAKQGEEGSEEDIDSPVSNPNKKARKVVITDESRHAEALDYEVLKMKRRLFDSVCRSDVSPVKRAEIFKALCDL